MPRNIRALLGGTAWTEYPERAAYTQDLVWTPYITDDGRVGYRVSTLDGARETFIYFNPSHDGGNDANVFVYEGIENDPAEDEPQVFIAPEALINQEAPCP